jgi:hypothetical protein
MLLSEADVHEKNGKRRDAGKIRAWVADLLSQQSEVVRSVWGAPMLISARSEKSRKAKQLSLHPQDYI